VGASDDSASGQPRDLSCRPRPPHPGRAPRTAYSRRIQTDWYSCVHAAWLAVDPGTPASARSNTDVIVGGATAAWLHNVGDLQPTPYTFLTQRRRQTKRDDVRFRQRQVDPIDITTIAGIPTTTITRTLADLVLDHEDVAQGKEPSRERLADLLAPDAARRGLPESDGAAVYAQLEERAGTDVNGRLTTLSRRGVVPQVLDLATRTLIDNYFEEQLAPIHELAAKFKLSDQATRLIAKSVFSQTQLAAFRNAIPQDQLNEIAARALAPGVIDAVRGLPTAANGLGPPPNDDEQETSDDG
jgi:hypothetical protein